MGPRIEYAPMSSTESAAGLAVQPYAAAGVAVGRPWRQGNRFQLLADSDRIFRRMLEAIAAARESVLLEMYLVDSGTVARRFIHELAACAQRGVRVHVLFDAFGSLGLRAADRRRLADSGAHLTFFNPLSLRKRLQNCLRDHRKLLVVDGTLAFVGGVGLADEFIDGKRGRLAWRDLMLEISGPVVADWQTAFAHNWGRSGGSPEVPEGIPLSPDERSVAAGALGRVALSEAGHRSILAGDVVHRINGALQRAWIMSAYFVPSRRFRKALRRAARRGVDVRLLVPGPKTDHPWVRHAARRFYGKLLRNGVRIFEYQPRVLHGKMALCDDWVSLGSSNLDRWSFRWNLEANQEIESAAVAAQAAAIFAADCGDSHELNRRHWRHRAVLDRLRESIAGALDRLLDGWRRPRGR
jgi:cardiolipin synthase A/B